MIEIRDFQKEIDAFFELNTAQSKIDLPTRDILNVAKVGWAKPSVLSLEEVQELCRALVILDSKVKEALKGRA